MGLGDIKAYRLVKRKWKNSAFDGEGAKRFGGRWNSKGNAAVYLASSESLAILEVMVHLNHYALLKAYSLFEVKLPMDQVLRLEDKDLPENWQEDPAPEETAFIGDYWLEAQLSLALDVPSAVIPRERNYVLNPAHPNFDSVVALQVELPFSADSRL